MPVKTYGPHSYPQMWSSRYDPKTLKGRGAQELLVIGQLVPIAPYDETDGRSTEWAAMVVDAFKRHHPDWWGDWLTYMPPPAVADAVFRTWLAAQR